MRWFKHFADASDDEKLSEVLCVHGAAAYGVFWLIVEAVSAQMDKTDRCFARYHIKKWATITHVDRRTLTRYLQTFNILTLIVQQDCDNFVTIEIPKLLTLRDNYTKDLQVTTRKTSKQEVEVEVEVVKPVTEKSTEEKEVCTKIIGYLNFKTGKSFRSTTAETVKFISARLKEGFTVEDFNAVVDNQCHDWLGDPKMEKFIRPKTLFSASKFDGYLQNTPPEKRPVY